jgi:signal peptidase II
VQKYRRVAGAVIMAAVLLLTVGCDQGTKVLARSYLGQGNVVSLLGGVLVMRYVENQGAFLSLGAWLPRPVRQAVFIIFPLAVLAGMVVYVVRKKDIRLMPAAGFAFVAGGGIGNLLDRIAHDGRVGDFLNVGIGGARTGIFNAADLAIMFGCLLLLTDAVRAWGTE